MQWAQTEAQEIPSKHQKRFVCCEVGWAVAQAVQRGCGVSILGDI